MSNKINGCGVSNYKLQEQHTNFHKKRKQIKGVVGVGKYIMNAVWRICTSFTSTLLADNGAEIVAQTFEDYCTSWCSSFTVGDQRDNTQLKVIEPEKNKK